MPTGQTGGRTDGRTLLFPLRRGQRVTVSSSEHAFAQRDMAFDYPLWLL